jgi:predicted membrane chloride channel (bestrophin family)
MIDYDFGEWGIGFIWQVEGSVFPKVFCFAIPSTLITTGLNLWFTWLWGNDKPDIQGAMGVWGSFTFVLGFLIVFRTQIAYGRFWEGGTTLQQVRGVWFNATSNLFAFCESDTHFHAQVERFQHLLVRLMSLLYCSALQQVADMGDEDFEVIEFTGIDEDSLEYLREAEDKTEVILQWVQRLIVINIDNGVIPIAPPIASRVFQELSNGIVDVQNARKIQEFPFPFPYAQMLTAMLLVHWTLTPIIAALIVNHFAIGAIITFVTTFSLWSINFIAAELEMPFGDDPNDLPVESMQTAFNRSLRTLLNPLVQCPPNFKFNKDLHPKLQGIRNNLTSRTRHVDEDDEAAQARKTQIARMSRAERQKSVWGAEGVGLRSSELTRLGLNKSEACDEERSIDIDMFEPEFTQTRSNLGDDMSRQQSEKQHQSNASKVKEEDSVLDTPERSRAAGAALEAGVAGPDDVEPFLVAAVELPSCSKQPVRPGSYKNQQGLVSSRNNSPSRVAEDDQLPVQPPGRFGPGRSRFLGQEPAVDQGPLPAPAADFSEARPIALSLELEEGRARPNGNSVDLPLPRTNLVGIGANLMATPLSATSGTTASASHMPQPQMLSMSYFDTRTFTCPEPPPVPGGEDRGDYPPERSVERTKPPGHDPRNNVIL